ncbi:NAD(P)-dependent oxidoreductase [Pararhodonellum marinum]|uniref:NAD(P)-dependent oxidoreductase n=1 Tax=Pararhodonellum marinum TaxID=2755358 RepID=UPI00188F2B7E|nr:SDR family oxidoreductase [Pararhodonellum marinum]
MRVLVFGANGTVGKHLVSQGLEKGHFVTAFMRHPEKLAFQHPSLQKVKGDVLDPQSIRKVMDGQNAVLISLGDGRKGTVRAYGTAQIVKSMEDAGVNRLICQTTLGCGESWQNLNFFWKKVMFGWFLKAAFEDHQLQEKHVMESGLDWTIVRPGAFTDGPLTKSYRENFSPEATDLKLKISRADLAYFILHEINEAKYLKQAVGLSY